MHAGGDCLHCAEPKTLISNIDTNSLHSDIITLSHLIGRGFEGLTIEDIAELRIDEAPNEE